MQEVPEVRLERLLLLAREHLRGRSLEQGLQEVEAILAISPEEDLNKLSDADLQRRKDLMELKFDRNNVKKGDPGFVYDKEVSFGAAVDPAGWDEETEEDESISAPAPIHAQVSTRVGAPATSPLRWEDESSEEDSTPRVPEPLARRFPGVQEPKEIKAPETKEVKEPEVEEELSVPEQTDEEEFW